MRSGPRITHRRVEGAPGISTMDIPRPEGRPMLPLLSSPLIVCLIPFTFVISMLAALLAAGIGGIA